MKYKISRTYNLEDTKLFKKLVEVNQNSWRPYGTPDELDVTGIYCHSIHWLAISRVLWPDFTSIDRYVVGWRYIARNDPEYESLPKAFFEEMADTIHTLWTIQLNGLYPNGGWTCDIWRIAYGDDDDTVVAYIDREEVDRRHSDP